MGINRRNFFKVLGVTGLTLATGSALKTKAAPANNNTEFYGILYDSTRCLGCQACERMCAKEHNLPEPTEEPKIGLERKTNEKRRTVVNNYNTSKGEFKAKKQCMHCNEPACAAACLTQAMYKTKEGPVIWREEKCMGCRYCKL